jgi:asparagine synthetase B (glutamine-hydrolysing)
MEIIIGKQNEIKHSSIHLKNGLNVIGNINGIVSPNTFLLRPIDKKLENLDFSQFSPKEMNGKAIFIFLKNNLIFDWALSDFSGISDIFYGKINKGDYVIGDNFLEILHRFSSLTLSEENIIFFIRHGYFPPGKTFFEEILRLRVGNKLKLENDFFEVSDLGLNENKVATNYKNFKEAFSSVIESIGIEDNDTILLSGGVDSNLITALSVLRFLKHPTSITIRYNQSLKCNKMDYILSKKIANVLDIKHSVVNIDFNEEKLSSLSMVIENMPLSAHLSLGFLKLSKQAFEMGATKIWCGQNADSLYNLGPTEKSLGGPIKRFYLTKEYISSLSGIKDKTHLAILWRSIGELGRLAFRAKRGLKIRQPQNFREFLSAYENSEEYLALPFKNSKITDKSIPENHLGYREARRIFFDRKLQSFITGRDPRVVYASSKEYGIKSILPYSAVNMIFFFRDLEMNLSDVLKLKKFIHRYLEELYGNKQYKQIYSLRKKEYQENSEKFLTYRNWQKKIVQETKFGQELNHKTNSINSFSDFTKRIQNSYNPFDIQHLIGVFWFKSILEKVKSFGVDVRID